MSLRSNITEAIDDILRVSNETATLNGSTADTSKSMAFSISVMTKILDESASFKNDWEKLYRSLV